MEFNAYSMLVDFMWAGIFLFIAKILREKTVSYTHLDVYKRQDMVRSGR